jgi:two-component system, cell cycle sensor histidine kinase and response regulator CckA
MKPPLRILHLEDDPNDAALIQSTLESEGIPFSITRVESADEFAAALERGGVDLILSDNLLPGFNGIAALKIAHARRPSIPFIFISGTLGEERAIDSLKSGATDYVLKDRLARLGPAVRRAMQEVEEREAKRRAEEALRRTEQRLQIVFSESPLGIELGGEDGSQVLTNPALQKMLGYTGEELARMPTAELTYPDDRGKNTELFQKLAEGGHNTCSVEKRYIRKDGAVVWARVSAGMARAKNGDSAFSIKMVEDITKHRELEAQVIEAQKMEVIGQLAGGVAHDFNNILAVIMGYTDLATQKVPAESELRGYLETIRSAAERATGLTRQLLVFSRKQKVQMVVVDVNEVIKDLDKMLRRLIDEHIEMTIASGRELGRVKADSGYLGQVVMNLVINARDAMPNGGKLTIATENVKLDEDYARSRDGAIAGDYVMIKVSDTGMGMTDAVKKRIFEAFFTTKPKGKGTGLGLATCQTIVQQAGGHIDVQSEVGQGTTFKIYFPRVDQPLDVASHKKNEPAPRGSETLLVVEDEPLLRNMARSVLEAKGYQVLTASNGQDALHTVRDFKGGPIRLIISDVVMPVMGGVVMAEWLKSANPDVKILFTSGYTDDTITLQGALQKGVEFLAKPYAPATLACKVREMLDNK